MNFVDRFLKFLKHIKNKLVILVMGRKISEEEEKQFLTAYKEMYQKSPLEAKLILRRLGGEDPTLVDWINDFFKMDIKKGTCATLFRELLIILTKMEEKELYSFVSDEVHEGYDSSAELKEKIEELKGEIKLYGSKKEKEAKEEEILKLKYNVLLSRVHVYSEDNVKKTHYFIKPLINWGVLPNEQLLWGTTVDSLFSRTFQILVREIDKFFLSWVAKEQR